MSDFGDLTAKPTAPKQTRRKGGAQANAVTVSGDSASVEVPDGPDAEGTALEFLKQEGLTPEEWRVTAFTKSEYGGKTAVKYSYRRTSASPAAPLSDAELESVLQARKPVNVAQNGLQAPSRAYMVALGDCQYGKFDGDGVVGTIERTMRTLEQAFANFSWYAGRYDINSIVIGFLGDHIEGFNSQGGANAWRTPLPLTEQIRITRRIMLYAVQMFNELNLPVHVVAVPGNHGEAVRFGSGITRYDDSHDTECLISVADATALNPEAFANVKYYVPETDELSVPLIVNDTNLVFTHGHKIKAGKHHEWVKGQAYNRNSIFRDCDVVVCGHYHYFLMEESSDRVVLQVPTLEGGSQWWKHLKGDEAQRGIVTALVGDGRIDHVEIVR